MGQCDECGETGEMPNTCNYCGRPFCSKHLLPENHDCLGLKSAETLGPDFRNDDSESGSRDIPTLSGDGADSKPTPGDDKSDTDNSHPSSTPSYSSSPDVAPDGSVQKEHNGSASDSSSGSTNSVLLALKGAFAGKHYKGDCPNCGHWVSKRHNDRYTRCKRCGWKAGIPVMRLLTHWPNWTLWKRRGKRWAKWGPLLFLVVLIGLLVVGGTVGTGIQPVDQAGGSLFGTAGLPSIINEIQITDTTQSATTPQQQQQTSASSTEKGRGGSSGLDVAEIEQYIHREVNERRESRSLSPLQTSESLHDIAEYHSRDMATNDYYNHTAPDGETMEDRYEKFNYNCRVETSGNRYATGAENINSVYLFTKYEVSGTGDVVRLDDEQEIAEVVVTEWMHSEGHRKNILRQYWKHEGVGVYVDSEGSETQLFVTQNFC